VLYFIGERELDFHKHVENIDMKMEGARAGSVVGARTALKIKKGEPNEAEQDKA
jgi:hypothetical protein